MTVEASLTRELNIRFIDARKLASEAKVNLGIEGYPSKYQLRMVRREAIRIFESQPTNKRVLMRQMSQELEAAKVAGSNHSAMSLDSTDGGASFCSEEIEADHEEEVDSCNKNQGRGFRLQARFMRRRQSS